MLSIKLYMILDSLTFTFDVIHTWSLCSSSLSLSHLHGFYYEVSMANYYRKSSGPSALLCRMPPFIEDQDDNIIHVVYNEKDQQLRHIKRSRESNVFLEYTKTTCILYE